MKVDLLFQGESGLWRQNFFVLKSPNHRKLAEMGRSEQGQAGYGRFWRKSAEVQSLVTFLSLSWSGN